MSNLDRLLARDKPYLEVLGSPKTVRLSGQYKGEEFSAPMEVWIMSLVAMLSDTDRGRFFTLLKQVNSNGEYRQIERAKVVADIPMPNI